MSTLDLDGPVLPKRLKKSRPILENPQIPISKQFLKSVRPKSKKDIFCLESCVLYKKNNGMIGW